MSVVQKQGVIITHRKGEGWTVAVRNTPRPDPPRKNGQICGAMAGQNKGHTLETLQFRKPIMDNDYDHNYDY